tara:strand:- start:3066 stop:3347 length:282 start_codon:yes stop_codon:yes gene_type:complete
MADARGFRVGPLVAHKPLWDTAPPTASLYESVSKAVKRWECWVCLCLILLLPVAILTPVLVATSSTASLLHHAAAGTMPSMPPPAPRAPPPPP